MALPNPSFSGVKIAEGVHRRSKHQQAIPPKTMTFQKINTQHWRRLLSGSLPRPAGEDFFLFAVRFPGSPDPCWDDGFDVVGNWKSSCAIFRRHMVLQPDQNRMTRLEIFQGDAARAQLAYNLAEERRYQQQRKAQPNN